MSLRMPSAKSAAVLPTAVTDKFRSRAMATGDLAAAIASCSRRLTIDAGVRAGASSPCQPAIWKPGKVSAIVGRSGVWVYRARFFGHKFDLSGVLHVDFLPGETRLARAA